MNLTLRGASCDEAREAEFVGFNREGTRVCTLLRIDVEGRHEASSDRAEESANMVAVSE